jgi:hypothetical protein
VWPRSLLFDDTYEWWAGSVRLPVLQSARISVPNRRPSRRAVEILLKTDEDGPTDGQSAAFQHLRSKQRQVLAVALKTIARWARKTREIYRTWYTEEELEKLLPRKPTPRDLMSRVSLYHLGFPDRELHGMAYVEYGFNCAWDKEHGILVVLHGQREKYTGFEGDGWD